MIQETRIRHLNEAPDRKGDYVLYWMQASQRIRMNHALTYAIRAANERKLPVLIGFGLTDDYPEANERHYAFMLEGLRDVSRSARNRGLGFVVRRGSPDETAIALSKDAALVVTDRGYLRLQRDWRARAANEIGCALVEVETDAVVPVEVASDKEAYAARTLRPKIQSALPDYLAELTETRNRYRFEADVPDHFDVEDVDGALAALSIDRSVRRVSDYRGGEVGACRRLRAFVSDRLARYDEDRNDPTVDGVSHMSPYLHFGQVSALDIALTVREAEEGTDDENVDAYLEELIVRRELSINFCSYNPDYDRYASLPDWAKKTLDKHRDDEREYVYDRAAFEAAETHDPYWNAAQMEMVTTGKMHNYMRMYWGKKIIEWSDSPEEAFETALTLNNRYELDGRDVNSFAGVAWCFGKHDRPWQERDVFGTVRYMNANGLKRKFDADGYVEKIASATGHPLDGGDRAA